MRSCSIPIILAVNGIVETYPVKPAVPQNVRADSLGEREHHGQQSSSLDRSVLAAQTAYEQQSIQRPHPKPAILARDLMNAPAVSLPSDSTLLDACVSCQKGIPPSPCHFDAWHTRWDGIVSRSTSLCARTDTAADTRQASRRRLAEIMTSRVISATPVTEILEIALVMLDERIHAVPIWITIAAP